MFYKFVIMKYIIFLLFGLIFSSSFAQMIDNSKGKAFDDRPFFNVKFIKNNKIKKIKGYFSTKANLDLIRPNENIFVYDFNESGQLIKSYETKYGDTLINQYEYDIKGNVILHRKSDHYGFHSYTYKYDSLNRVIYKEYRRDLNRGKGRLNFELDKTYRISSESYTYEDTPIGLKKKYYNSNGKIFKIEFIYTDGNGYLTKKEAKLVNSNGRYITTFSYNEKGLLKEKYSEAFLVNKSSTKLLFEYDENQNLLAQHYYRNGNYITEYQIVYNSKTLLLNALITRDVATNFMTIIKFSDYDYYK